MNLLKKSTPPDYWETTADAVVAEYKRLSAAMDAAAAAGCLDPNGPLFDAVWRSFDGMLSLVDEGDRIRWFVYDNQCGKLGLAPSAWNQKTRPIRTTKQLARLIGASR